MQTNVIAFPVANEFRALQAERGRLLAQDATFGARVSGEAARVLEGVLEALDEVESALLTLPADCADHAAEKLRIIGRAIATGADAEHVGRLFALATTDLARFPGATA